MHLVCNFLCNCLDVHEETLNRYRSNEYLAVYRGQRVNWRDRSKLFNRWLSYHLDN